MNRDKANTVGNIGVFGESFVRGKERVDWQAVADGIQKPAALIVLVTLARYEQLVLDENGAACLLKPSPCKYQRRLKFTDF